MWFEIQVFLAFSVFEWPDLRGVVLVVVFLVVFVWFWRFSSMAGYEPPVTPDLRRFQWNLGVSHCVTILRPKPELLIFFLFIEFSSFDLA